MRGPEALERAQEEDAVIVQRVRAGAREGFGELVTRHEGPLYRFLLVKTGGNEEAARELAQESFVTAYQRLDTLNEPRKFFAWLVGIARNRAMKWWTGRERGPVSLDALREQGWEASTPTAREPSLEAQEARVILVKEALAHLTEDDRAILTIRYLHGTSLHHVQDAMGLSASAAKMRVKRAREKLLKIIQRMERLC